MHSLKGKKLIITICVFLLIFIIYKNNQIRIEYKQYNVTLDTTKFINYNLNNQTYRKNIEKNITFDIIKIRNYNQNQSISFLKPNFKSKIETFNNRKNIEVTEDQVNKALELLQKNKVVLLDVDCFENFTLKACRKLDTHFVTGNDLHLAFGIFVDSFEKLNQAIFLRFTLKLFFSF